MRLNKTLLLLAALLLSTSVLAQDNRTGGVKGKVRVESGTADGVSVVVRQGDVEIARAITTKGGDFELKGLKPGRYGLTFKKTGLSVGTIEGIEIKSGKPKSLGDRLILTIDEGSIAFIRGSVFNEGDRSLPNVKIELARVEADGTLKKIDSRVSNEIGAFVFRLTPEVRKYRITAKPPRGEEVIKDVDIDGPAVYRIAISIKNPAK